MEPNTDTAAVFTSDKGPIYRPIFMERQVKVYAVHEPELRYLSVLSAIQNSVASVGGGIFGFLVSIGWDVITSTEVVKQKMGMGVMFVCGAGLAACVAVWVWAFFRKKTELQQILSETKIIGATS